MRKTTGKCIWTSVPARVCWRRLDKRALMSTANRLCYASPARQWGICSLSDRHVDAGLLSSVLELFVLGPVRRLSHVWVTRIIVTSLEIFAPSKLTAAFALV